MRVRTDTCSMLRSCFGGAHAATFPYDERKKRVVCADRAGGSNAVASRHRTGLHLSECGAASVLHNVANVINVMEIRGGVAGGMERKAHAAFVVWVIITVAQLGLEPGRRSKSSLMEKTEERATSIRVLFKMLLLCRGPELAPA